MSVMFGFCYKLKNLDFASGTFDTSKVTGMGGMFRSCYELTAEDFYEIFSHFTETTSLTNVGAIFNSCYGLEEFKWPTVLNTEKVTYMREVFQYAKNLTTVDLTNMDTKQVTNVQQFFNGCSSLTTIIVDDSWYMDMDIIEDYVGMFSGCSNLVGGNGTKFADMKNADSENNNYTTHKYAVIDGMEGNKGYLTCVHTGEDSYFGDGDVCEICGYDKSRNTYNLNKDEEKSSIDFDFGGIDDTNLEWLPISDYEDMMPYPNEDYKIKFKANEGYKLPDTIKVEIDGTVYNVAVSGENAEGEPTFANGILTIPAELMTAETKSLVITVSAIPVDEQTEEKPTDEEKTDEEQKPTEETDDKKDETETDKSEDTSNGDTTTGGSDTSEEIKKEFNIDTTDLENAEIKCTSDEDGNAKLVIKADKGYSLPETFIISIGGTEYEIDTTTEEQEDGILWNSETNTLTIPNDLVSSEDVEIGVKLQAIIKEDDDEDADKKPEEDKNPDGEDDTEDTETDTPVIPPVTDDEQTGGNNGEENGDGTDEGGEENGGGDNVPPAIEGTPTQPPVTGNNGAEETGGETGSEDTNPVVPNDKVETPGEDNKGEDTSSDSTETGGTDDTASGGTESGNDTQQGDTSASESNNSTGESTDTSGSTTDDAPAAPPASESNNNSVAAPVAPSTSTGTQGSDSSQGNSQGSGSTGGASGGDGSSSSNTSTGTTSTATNTTAKKQTETIGGDDSGDSN